MDLFASSLLVTRNPLTEPISTITDEKKDKASDAIPQKQCYDTKLHLTWIESKNDRLEPWGQSYARSPKKEGCVAKLLSAAITHTA